MDGSYEWGFGVAVHQLDAEKVERRILFLSKELAPADRNYDATELECAALVWALTKLPPIYRRISFRGHKEIPLVGLLGSIVGLCFLVLTFLACTYYTTRAVYIPKQMPYRECLFLRPSMIPSHLPV